MNVKLHSSPYRKRPLGEVADVISGFAFKSTDFGDKGIPVIKIKNIRLGHVDLNEASYVDEKHLSIPDRFHVKSGDVLISLTGSHITQPNSVVGRIARHSDGQPRCLLNQRAGKIIAKDKRVCDPRFLFYALSEQETMLAIAVKAHGAASQANVSPSQVESIEIPFPPFPVQQRIAGILSAYDELIENSQRRIKILEAMARGLYREWFVHFRFPGYENHLREASALGEIPHGWEVNKLFVLTSVSYGKNLPTKKLSDDGNYPVYGAAKVIGRYTEFTREQPTIICGCRGSVGEMQITQPKCFVTNNSFTFDPTHPDNFFWLFHALKERGLRDVVGGAAQPQITLEGISSVELVTPPLTLRTRFQNTVFPIFEQTWLLDSQIQNLRRTRDLLLPRLLSGQINVEAAEHV